MKETELFRVIHEATQDKRRVLDLSGFWDSGRLTRLPPEIGVLTSLEELDLKNNELTVLPPEIGQLTNLKKLILRNNKLTVLPPEIGQLTNLIILDLHNNRLMALPPEIGQLVSLGYLDLTQNSLSELPPEIGKLHHLDSLNLRNNKLIMLPSEVGNLVRLRYLNLSSKPGLFKLGFGENQITTLPPELGQLTKLTELILYDEYNSEYREYTIKKFTSPPPEVTEQGTKAILTFLRNIQVSQTRRYEAKLLILGQGGVGKSSILRNLLGQPFITDLETTHGVDVARVEIPHPNQADITLQMNAWDFAGQEIEHATHQFFMSSKSVYLLVWNTRHGHIQGRLDYWMEMIQSRAPEAPVLLVATHIDQRAPDINFAALKETYPQLGPEHAVDNESGRGIKDLRRAIAQAAAGLPLMGQAWPGSWGTTEHELKNLNEHHISYNRFVKICQSHGLTGQRDIEILADTLHNLGIILHFDDDPALKNLVVLKPNWITKAISYALTDSVTRTNYGRLRHADLPRIWRPYDPALYPAFYSLMSKFDLAYKFEDIEEQSLIPALLPYKPPQTPIIPYRLEMVYQLSSVPAGLMSRFIVRTHRFTQSIHWREGCMLAYDGQWARAELFENRREFRLAVGGSSPTNFFAILTDTMNQILTDYPGLTITRLIPCICRGDGSTSERCPHFFSYESLVARSQRGISTIQCDISYQGVSVNELLYGIHESARSQVLEQVVQIQAMTEKDRQLILLGQRGLIHEYNRLESIDTRCPNIFVVSQRQSEGGRLTIQLVCQSSEGWHIASQAARYLLPRSKDRILTVAPLLKESLPLLEHIIPLSGLNISLQTPVPKAEQLAYRADLKLIRQIASLIHSDRNRIEGLHEALRQLYALLAELDPDHTYGGLRLATTPAGQRLWLCPYHYAELQSPPLQLARQFTFDVFLCHNSKNKDKVREVANALKKSGLKPWFDEEQILGGDRWQDAMARGLHECPATTVFVGSQGWGDWQLEELQVALSQGAGQKNHRVIPVLLPPLTKVPDDFPAFLKTRHALRLPERIDKDSVAELVRSIRGR